LPAADLSWREACEVLHAELDRLPDKFRLPLLLCYLEGKSRDEAAAQLSLTVDALKGRLERGRNELRERLRRRGVTLTAGLGAAVATSRASAVSARLIQATLSAAIGRTPVAVAAVVQGVTATMILSKFKFAAGLLLAAGLLGTLYLFPRLSPPALSAPTPPKPAPAWDQPPAAAAGKAAVRDPGGTVADVEFHGRVVDPDGKPLAGAKLFLADRTDAAGVGRRQVGTTDDGGRFQVTLPRAEWDSDQVLVTTADGLAPDWVGTRGLKAGQEITLRLARDDIPITGRLLNLEGRPLADINVELRWVGRKAGGDLGAWIDHFVAMWNKGSWIHEEGLEIARPVALGVPTAVRTDKEGRFALTGLGRDRLGTLVLRSETTALVRVQAVTRQGPGQGWVKGDLGLYPSRFDFVLQPCKPIVGTVRDRRTGQPVAGVKVVASGNWLAEATTDAQGRFRIIGTPKRDNYELGLGGRKGVPYLDYTRHEVPDTPGFEPVEVNLELERGLELTGKVTDQATGKPVRGQVMYMRIRDNPFLKDFTSPDSGLMIVSDWGKVQPDGTYTVLGLPGPGVLVVCAADSTRYPRINASEELNRLGVNGAPTDPAHRAVKVDPREDNPSSRTQDIVLAAGIVREGTVTDADGKALTGAEVVGLTDAESPRKLEQSTFTATGLQPQRARAMVFLHKDRRLGAVAEVRGDPDKPFTVMLRPLGSLTGRLVDDTGTPLAERRVVVLLALDSKKYENLPWEYHYLFDAFNLHAGSWRGFTGRDATTDKDGRFRIDGLIPGESYNLHAGVGDIERKGNVSHHKPKLTVGPGEEKDLGDMRPGTRERP
jgi:protocatechuate 3,4-dioxygenase beta subunit